MAKITAPALSLDELKANLQTLKTRADGLIAKKDQLVREATIQEQNRDRALQELTDLGYPQAKDLDIQGLANLGSDLLTQLNDALTGLGVAVEAAETAITSGAAPEV